MAIDAETRTWRNCRCAPSGMAAACAVRIITSSRSPPPIKTRMDCMRCHPSKQGRAYSAVALTLARAQLMWQSCRRWTERLSPELELRGPNNIPAHVQVCEQLHGLAEMTRSFFLIALH